MHLGCVASASRGKNRSISLHGMCCVNLTYRRIYTQNKLHNFNQCVWVRCRVRTVGVFGCLINDFLHFNYCRKTNNVTAASARVSEFGIQVINHSVFFAKMSPLRTYYTCFCLWSSDSGFRGQCAIYGRLVTGLGHYFDVNVLCCCCGIITIVIISI